MQIRSEQGIFISVMLYHAYILFVNTASLHGFYIPDVRVWTGVLLIPILYLTYDLLSEATDTVNEKAVYIAVITAIGGSLLRILGFGTDLIAYQILIVVIALFTAYGLYLIEHLRFRVFLVILIGAVIFFVSGIYFFEITTEVIGPVFELVILLGIIYYNFSFRQKSEEFFFIIIFTIFGYQLGQFINTLDVPPLIISTMFEQMLNVSQYSIIDGIDPDFFFALHMAEIFNILAMQFFKGRSWAANAIIFSGLDLSYPPLAALRALAVLILIRRLGAEKSSEEKDVDGGDQPKPEPGKENIEGD